MKALNRATSFLRRARWLAPAFAVLTGFQTPALAQDGAPLWELGLGVAALRLAHYRGAEQSRNWMLPLPYAIYRGRILRADREGARAVLLEAEGAQVDLSVAASAPTRSRDNVARQGMPDLAPTLEFGPSLNLRLAHGADWKLGLRAPLRAVITIQREPRQLGWTATPQLGLDWKWAGWNAGLQLGALWGDRRLHGYLYDVAPIHATALRPAYRAEAGAAGWQGTLGLSRQFDRLWLGAFVRADSVRGAAFEASPLVRRTDNVSFGVALSWVLAASATRVAPSD